MNAIHQFIRKRQLNFQRYIIGLTESNKNMNSISTRTYQISIPFQNIRSKFLFIRD